MNIQIGEDYRITSDQHNIILNKRREPKEGQEKQDDTYKPVAFYPNLEQACTGILEKSIKLSEATDLKGLAELMGTLTAQIVAAVKEGGQTK